jgi:hypothetical protein
MGPPALENPKPISSMGPLRQAVVMEGQSLPIRKKGNKKSETKSSDIFGTHIFYLF